MEDVMKKSAVKDASYYFAKAMSKVNKSESDEKRYSLYPVLDPDSFNFYQRQENQHWSAAELDYDEDKKTYNTLSDVEKHVIDTIIAYFILGDGGITESVLRFLIDGDNTLEDKSMFISQLHIELIHSETYSLAALAFKGEDEMIKLLTNIENSPATKAKVKFNEKWVESDTPKWMRLVASSIIEGLFFISGFAGIFYFRSKNKLDNFILANELISKDETLHRDYNVYLALRSMNDVDKNEGEKIIRQMIREGVEVEFQFVDELMSKGSLSDFNTKNIKTYVKSLADVLLACYGYSPEYNETNPFDWLKDLALQQKTNFYEKRVAAYVKRNLNEILNWKKRAGLINNAVVDPDEVEF